MLKYNKMDCDLFSKISVRDLEKFPQNSRFEVVWVWFPKGLLFRPNYDILEEYLEISGKLWIRCISFTVYNFFQETVFLRKRQKSFKRIY